MVQITYRKWVAQGIGRFCGIVAVALCFSSPPCKGQCIVRARLNKWEREQFVEAAQGTRTVVSAQFLSELGCAEKVFTALRHLGARIDFEDRRSGYVLVRISRRRLLDALDVAGIAYAYTSTDERIYKDAEPITVSSACKAAPVPAISIPYPRVAKTLALRGPYFAADEIGLTTLWKQHPEADGRGVRIAVADAGFDLLHPALLQARALSGEALPKVADIETLTAPDEDSDWVRFGGPSESQNRQLRADGNNWAVAKDGTYRFGLLRRNLVLGEEGNSDAKKLSLCVGVIWNVKDNLIWVDTDGDGSFRNERALGDYGPTHDVAWFGRKHGDDDNRIPFGVKIDRARKAAYVRIGGDHGELVGGALAGNKLTGGLFDGAAPGSQLVDARIGFPLATLIATMVDMARRPDIDAINRSGGIGRVAFPGYNQEGYEEFMQHVLERVISVYDKPIVAYSAAVGTIHVQDYASAEMLRRDRQLAPPYRDTVNSFVWDLPSGLVNTVLAPSVNLEAESRYMPFTLPRGDGRKSSFSDDWFEPPAPDGYMIGSNPSPAIPVVTGVLADLISEAKQQHYRYDSRRLNNAIFSSTRLLDGFPISEQGFGLLDAVGAWNQLVRMAKADDPVDPQLTSFVVSRIENGKRIEVQGFHADLPNPGEKLEDEIWITRHGGYEGGRRYTFSLRGNNGDFELLDDNATLSSGKPMRIRFRTNGQPGWNIVFLELRDATADVVMQDVPLSVRVPDTPETISPGINSYESTIPPLSGEYRYIRVDDDVQAVRYVMTIPYVGPYEISARVIPGGRYRTTMMPVGESVDAKHHVGPIEILESLVVNDEPGTREIFWENRGRPEYATQYDGPAPDVPIHATLTVANYALAISKIDAPIVSVTNRLANVEGRVNLFDARFATSEVKGHGNRAMAEVDRDVPEGLSEWRVRITGSTKSTHTDAYLLNCAGNDGCSVVSQEELTNKGASLVVEKPQAGKWKIILRSREPATGNTNYELTEARLTPTREGGAETDSRYGHGQTWTVAVPSSTRYAAFRIAGTPGVASEKDGLLIAMTPLNANLP
jgi:hypothetical protein